MMGRGFFSLPVQNTVHLGGEARMTGSGHAGHLASTVKKQQWMHTAAQLSFSIHTAQDPSQGNGAALMALVPACARRPTSQVTLNVCQAAADTSHPTSLTCFCYN